MSAFHSYMSCSIVELYGHGSLDVKNFHPLYGLAHKLYREPTKEDATCSIGFVATQYQAHIDMYKMKHKNGDDGQYLGPKGFILWSDHEGKYGWGPVFAQQINDLGVGEITKVGPIKNPCTSSADICVWICKINQEKFKEWYHSEFQKRSKDKES